MKLGRVQTISSHLVFKIEPFHNVRSGIFEMVKNGTVNYLLTYWYSTGGNRAEEKLSLKFALDTPRV